MSAKKKKNLGVRSKVRVRVRGVNGARVRVDRVRDRDGVTVDVGFG